MDSVVGLVQYSPVIFPSWTPNGGAGMSPSALAMGAGGISAPRQDFRISPPPPRWVTPSPVWPQPTFGPWGPSQRGFWPGTNPWAYNPYGPYRSMPYGWPVAGGEGMNPLYRTADKMISPKASPQVSSPAVSKPTVAPSTKPKTALPASKSIDPAGSQNAHMLFELPPEHQHPQSEQERLEFIIQRMRDQGNDKVPETLEEIEEISRSWL